MAAKKVAKKTAPKAPKVPNRARTVITETAVAKAATAAANPAEHRAPDQDAAVEAAFASGALPEGDRREPAHPKVYEWIARGDGVKQLYCNGVRCDEIPELDRDYVHALLEDEGPE